VGALLGARASLPAERAKRAQCPERDLPSPRKTSNQPLPESQASHAASGAAAKESAKERAALAEQRDAHHPGLAAPPVAGPAVAAARRYDGPDR